MADELNPKQLKFANEYIKTGNAKQSAIAAGYSEKSSEPTGHALIRNPKIKEYIEKRMAKAGINAQRVLNELAIIAFSDIQDYVEIEDGGSVIAKKFTEMTPQASRAISSIKEDRIIKEGSGKVNTVVHDKFEFKLYDKIKALELIGRYLKMFTDKVELEDITITVRKIITDKIPKNGLNGQNE